MDIYVNGQVLDAFGTVRGHFSLLLPHVLADELPEVTTVFEMNSRIALKVDRPEWSLKVESVTGANSV